MRHTVIAVVGGLLAAAAGCSTPATDAQLEGMCRKRVELEGGLRGTSEEEEVARIEEEYAVKERKLKEEMARDLKGLDDVLEQALRDIEASEPVPAEGDEGKSPEQLREEARAAQRASVEEKKKPIVEQFERLLELLGPQKGFQIENQKKYVAKNRKKAEQAIAGCVAEAKAEGVAAPVAECRAAAKTMADYSACR